MTPVAGGGSRALLRQLRHVMAEVGDGQERLDKIASAIAVCMSAEVCSIYLLREERLLELWATEGLRREAVHNTRFRFGQALVGRIAERIEPFATKNAPAEPGFEYRPETGEEIYSSFCGVPIQRLGRVIGVLVVQTIDPRDFDDDEIDALEVTAMVIAEMAESGLLIGDDGMRRRREGPQSYLGVAASEGAAVGPLHLHEPKLAITQPFTDNVEGELARLEVAMGDLRREVDSLLTTDIGGAGGEYRDVLEAYRMFAYDKGWQRRLNEAVASGVVAEVAVERVQSAARSRMERAANPYMRDRLHDLDDLANRLLRRLSGAAADGPPDGSILVARHIGPGELLDVAKSIKAVVLEEGGVGGHAAIVARALAVPMVVGAGHIVSHAEAGDVVAVDGDQGRAFLRPDAQVLDAFQEKEAMAEAARAGYRRLRDAPAVTKNGVEIDLAINAGLLSDMPKIAETGASGVGLYRTELQFLVRATLPSRTELAAAYGRVLDAAKGAPVAFRTLDIGSDKVLPYMRRPLEDNPALGWRALRVGLDRPHLLKMQFQALLRGAGARPLSVMFPFVADEAEFYEARDHLWRTRDWLQGRGYTVSDEIRIGAMLETPSLAHASDQFFRDVDFLSVGGNDLLQLLFAADRGNERVRRRYDALNPAFLRFLTAIVDRAAAAEASLSFCGEAAGRPLEALALAAIGFRALSMRPASVGPVKEAIRSVDLDEAAAVLSQHSGHGAAEFRKGFHAWALEAGAAV